MAKMVGLMGTDIHPIEDQWQGKKELHTANHVAKGSTKTFAISQVVSPIKSPKIMGLKGIHSPEALKCQAGLSPLPLVWKGGPKWGHHGESPPHQALPPQGGLWAVPSALYNQFGQNMVPFTGLQVHACLQQQGVRLISVIKHNWESDKSHQWYPQK